MTGKKGLLNAIAAFCRECSIAVESDAASCGLESCPLHPYRTGEDTKPCASGRKKASDDGE